MFGFRSVAERVKKDFENPMQALASGDEPNEPNYDSSLLNLGDFYRSDIYREYSQRLDEYRSACWLQNVSIATWVVDGRRV